MRIRRPQASFRFRRSGRARPGRPRHASRPRRSGDRSEPEFVVQGIADDLRSALKALQTVAERLKKQPGGGRDVPRSSPTACVRTCRPLRRGRTPTANGGRIASTSPDGGDFEWMAERSAPCGRPPFVGCPQPTSTRRPEGAKDAAQGGRKSGAAGACGSQQRRARKNASLCGDEGLRRFSFRFGGRSRIGQRRGQDSNLRYGMNRKPV